METAPNNTTFPLHRHCDVCGDPVVPIDALDQKEKEYISCRSLHCRGVVDQQSRMPRGPFIVYLDFHRELSLERRQQLADQNEREQEIQQWEAGENE